MHIHVRLHGLAGVGGMLVTRRRIEFSGRQTVLPSRCCHVPAMLISCSGPAGNSLSQQGGADRGRLYLQVLSRGGPLGVHRQAHRTVALQFRSGLFRARFRNTPSERFGVIERSISGRTQMSHSQPPLPDYARCNVPLKVLETSVSVSTTSPSAGYLEISTEDGLLRLVISADVAADLRIDLNQFLATRE